MTQNRSMNWQLPWGRHCLCGLDKGTPTFIKEEYLSELWLNKLREFDALVHPNHVFTIT